MGPKELVLIVLFGLIEGINTNDLYPNVYQVDYQDSSENIQIPYKSGKRSCLNVTVPEEDLYLGVILTTNDFALHYGGDTKRVYVPAHVPQSTTRWSCLVLTFNKACEVWKDYAFQKCPEGVEVAVVHRFARVYLHPFVNASVSGHTPVVHDRYVDKYDGSLQNCKNVTESTTSPGRSTTQTFPTSKKNATEKVVLLDAGLNANVTVTTSETPESLSTVVPTTGIPTSHSIDTSRSTSFLLTSQANRPTEGNVIDSISTWPLVLIVVVAVFALVLIGFIVLKYCKKDDRPGPAKDSQEIHPLNV